ncbi:hypothetical protein [Marinomonas balearica]|uniref:Uncharacterized protein n=1 Tax=Marinomonas balearica TaxID=491947 RepID=A0A4R6MB10_9GAMM|nr:hypothetical protein [Marinomonas balearica]TDO98768.1 hypothetical protein DFP79_1180 [Marinomonas balearica]
MFALSEKALPIEANLQDSRVRRSLTSIKNRLVSHTQVVARLTEGAVSEKCGVVHTLFRPLSEPSIEGIPVLSKRVVLVFFLVSTSFSIFVGLMVFIFSVMSKKSRLAGRRTA